MRTRIYRQCRRRIRSRIPLLGQWLRHRAAEALSQNTDDTRAVSLLARILDETRDETVREIARRTLEGLDTPEAIAAACETWHRARGRRLGALIVRRHADRNWIPEAPHPVRMATALLCDEPATAAAIGSGGTDVLIAACHDPADELHAKARACIRALTSQSAINAVCTRWMETRDGFLEDTIVQAGYAASYPPPVRVYSALKSGKADRLRRAKADVIAPLLSALRDDDAQLADAAATTLRDLTSEETREEICRLVIEQQNPDAQSAALDAGYLPANPQQRALFLFMTEQWDRYETVDFDRRLLRVAYETASPERRERIRRLLRASGRNDFLKIVAGGERTRRVAEMSNEEIGFYVRMQREAGNWEELWTTAREVSLDHSLDVIAMLAQSPWRPDGPDERALFDRLAELRTEHLSDPLDDIVKTVPPVLRRAELKAPGRINDLSFASGRPHILAGTGSGTVVLWNYKEGRRERRWGGFDHSIGRVTMLENGTPAWAERTNGSQSCSVYVGTDREPQTLSEFAGSVTALEPIGEGRLLATGRRHSARILLPGRRKPLCERTFNFWVRQARKCPGQDAVALGYDGVAVVELPSLRVRSRIGIVALKSTARTLAYGPGGQDLVIGKHSGQVSVFRENGSGRLDPVHHPLTFHEGRAEGVESIPNHRAIVSAGSEGLMRFTDAKSGRSLGAIAAPGDRPTSLHVAPEAPVLALGHRDGSVSLWDLHPLDLPRLMRHPLARMTPNDLGTLKALSDREPLPEAARATTRYMESIVHHRLRHAPEIVETADILEGEFDIEIDDEV